MYIIETWDFYMRMNCGSAPRHIMPQRCKYTVSHTVARNDSFPLQKRVCMRANRVSRDCGWNSLPVDRVRPWIGRELVPPAEEEHSLGKTGPRSSLSSYHPINVQRADQRERSLCILPTAPDRHTGAERPAWGVPPTRSRVPLLG